MLDNYHKFFKFKLYMKKLLLFLISSFLLVGCVTSEKDEFSRQIRIESNPAGATVIVDGFKLGKTPLDIAVESTENGFFVRKTTITLIPVDSKHFTQVETFSGFRRSSESNSEIPEKMVFDLTKNPEKDKTVTIE